jgi:hypothetical protein
MSRTLLAELGSVPGPAAGRAIGRYQRSGHHHWTAQPPTTPPGPGPGYGPVTVDLTALDFCDAQGLAALVRMAGHAAEGLPIPAGLTQSITSQDHADHRPGPQVPRLPVVRAPSLTSSAATFESRRGRTGSIAPRWRLPYVAADTGGRSTASGQRNGLVARANTHRSVRLVAPGVITCRGAQIS